MKDIVLTKKSGVAVNASLKILDESYIDKIMELEKEIVDGLTDKNLYADSDRERFLECIRGNGKIVGCITSKDELVAMGVYVSFGYEEENYGYDLGIAGEDLLAVGQIESTTVKNEYRGNKLQDRICDMLEEMAIQENKKIVGATVAPENKYSLNTFLGRGYSIENEKIKYGGYRRYILKKIIL